MVGLRTSHGVAVAGKVIGTLAPGLALAAPHAIDPRDARPNGDEPEIQVTGVRSLTSDKISDGVLNAAQTIDVIPRAVMDHQATTRLQDALKNVPGITLNAGEGAARGDTVNLRGFPAFNDFFLDGIRDAAVYSRDSFDLESIEVLKGPSAILFGRGSTGGAINQVSKAPTLAPLFAATLVGGTNGTLRATADIDVPLAEDAAVRLNAMGERSDVADRDQVRNRRWGIAPSATIGIGGPDTLMATYLHQEENNVPDVGVPFVGGLPANVNRANDYGLTSDRRTSTVDIGTLRYRHRFSGNVTIANTLRYAAYDFTDVFNAPNFGYAGGPGAPSAGAPLAGVLIGRDSPSSYGHRTNFINQIDLTAHFATGPIVHTLVAGTEFGRERDATTRLVNPFGAAGETAPTSLLAPNPYEASVAQPGRLQGITTAYSAAAYITDTLHIGDRIDLTGGVRFDRFSAHYRPVALIAGIPAASLLPLDHVDHVWSPRVSIVYKPGERTRLYLSYGTSFDPSAEALSLNAKTASLGPVKAKSFEVGAKQDWFGGKLAGTAALFRTQIDNAQTNDPDHPTRTVLAGNQRVDGVELSLSGRLTAKWEIIAGYTYLDGKTIASTTTNTVGKQLANVAHNAVNLWTEYEFSDRLELGIGGNYLGRRYADFAQSAVLPSYVLLDAMVSYQLTPHLNLRVNGTNLLDKLAWQSTYYATANENHAIPAPGRTVLFTLAVRY